MKINRNNVESLHQVNVQKDSKAEKKGKNKQQQITDISNVCYKPLSFGRSWAEHKSWGGIIDPETKESKMYAYPVEVSDYNSPQDCKIGDICAIDDNTLLVIEQGKDKDKCDLPYGRRIPQGRYGILRKRKLHCYRPS